MSGEQKDLGQVQKNTSIIFWASPQLQGMQRGPGRKGWLSLRKFTKYSGWIGSQRSATGRVDKKEERPVS
jgi:hypothetical protein